MISSFHLREFYLANRRALGWGALLAASFAACYARVFGALVTQWGSNDMYSYGFLIPFVSLYLVWARRERVLPLRPQPRPVGGFTMVAFSLGMLAAGGAGGVVALQELSLIGLLAGGVVLILGREFFRALFFPIAYLLFMIPVWEIITDRLHFPFQVFSANVGVGLLQAFGLPVYRQGVYIELPNITLEVAKVCSGVNYLLSVIAIGAPMAYLFLKRPLLRALLILFSVAVAVLSNGARVALIGALSYYGIGGNIHGPFHLLQGLSVSMVGYGAIFAGLWALSKIPSPPSAPMAERISERVAQPSVPAPALGWGKSIPPLALSLSALLLLTGGFLHFHRPSSVPLKRDLKDFPLEIGAWQGREAAPVYTLYRDIGIDQDLSRAYRTDSGLSATLYIGYFEFQRQGRELINYKANDLFREASTEEMFLNTGERIKVNTFIKRERGGSRLICFWYDLNGRIVTSRYLAKLYTVWDVFAHGRTNGAIILLASDVMQDGTLDVEEGRLERARLSLEAFMQDLFGALPGALPRG
ncbi:MAG TPA: exosortase W [Candidatus Manganitrophaceae bacterium]|nr:exosortase W [Candidatus Manganitrophaceae bacterium]